MTVTALLMIFVCIARHGVCGGIMGGTLMRHIMACMIRRWHRSISNLSMLTSRHHHAGNSRNR
jgi:hypothetical protein